jgi:class 3 adenylate cyclase
MMAPALGVPSRDMDAGLPRGTVTFLFSDIEGSTELSRRHGAAYGDLRAEHRRLLREALEAHRGHEVDAEGDAFFVVFERATDAVAAAVAAQRALVAADAVRVRIGLHTTEPHLHSDGYVGVGVSRAARICAAAHGGQIVLSHATAGIVEDDEKLDVRLSDLGDHYLKDISRPQRLFQIDADGLPSEFPPLGTRAAAGTIATLLAIDLAGWRRVMRELGDDGAAAAAAAYHRIVAETARANDGVEVERAADWAMCVFSSPKSALLAVAAIRAELRNSDWIPGIEKPELAAAVHTGRVTSLAGGQLGSPALRATLLCNSAEPGQVLVSHSTQALLEGEILRELELRDLGERELPGMTPTRVFELLGPSASS